MAAPIGNKYAIGNNGGRPPIYANPDDLIKACEDYFIYIQGEWHEKSVKEKDEKTGKQVTKIIKVWDRYPEPATVTGLTLHLGFADKCSLDDYEKKEEFSHIIKKARKIVEYHYEMRLHGDKNTGAIFALKNMGWSDKQELEHSGGLQLNWHEEKTYEAKPEANPGA